MSCTIYQSDEDTKYLDLFVIGSEGTNVCHECEMSLVNHITLMRRLAFKMRKMLHKNRRVI